MLLFKLGSRKTPLAAQSAALNMRIKLIYLVVPDSVKIYSVKNQCCGTGFGRIGHHFAGSGSHPGPADPEPNPHTDPYPFAPKVKVNCMLLSPEIAIYFPKMQYTGSGTLKNI
jgi:hypothetical protein